MSEASELKAFKEKLDRKYGKIAKKRLNKINQRVAPNFDLMDMSDEKFDEFVNGLVNMINQNRQRNNQQQQPQQQARR